MRKPKERRFETADQTKGDFKPPLLGLLARAFPPASVTLLWRSPSSSARRNSRNPTSSRRSRNALIENAGIAGRPSPGHGRHDHSLAGACAVTRSALYPEYTGTIGEEILKCRRRPRADRDAGATRQIRSRDDRTSSGSTTPMPWSCGGLSPSKKQIRTISDLRNHPELEVRADP